MKRNSLIILFSINLLFLTSLSAYKGIDYKKKVREDIDTVNVGGDKYRVKWLLKENFDKEDWRASWVLEATKADVEIKDGKLHILDYGVGTTLWHKKEFPANIFIRYKTRTEGGMADNKLNFNHISHATETDGSILKIGKESKRTGAYTQYHQFPNYIATLTYKHSRIRKNSGFELLSDSKEAAALDSIYEVVCLVYNGRIRYYLNGAKVHDVKDPKKALPGGKFGLRTWNTKAWWDDIEIGVLEGF